MEIPNNKNGKYKYQLHVDGRRTAQFIKILLKL